MHWLWPGWRVLGVLLLCAGSLLSRPDAVARAQDGLNVDHIARATVFIMSVYGIPDGRAVSCIGSGTLVSADGLILTNAHNVLDSERCRVDDLAIALTVRLDEPPVPTYFADVVYFDLGLDLAVLRVARQIDGRTVDRSTLSLPFVELGDSSQLRLDDTLTVFGYPGLGNDPVEARRGTVLGFTAEANAGERAWIKTGATIPGTMSGGGAYDEAGRLIGIPTTAPVGPAAEALDCRAVQDTNADGLVDSRDDCIPVGGFINALRPAALARGLVRAAFWGIRDGGHQFSDRVAAFRGEGEPAFSRLFFSPAVNEAGMPTTAVTQLPAGTNSLYLFFDYEHMRPGLVYELRTTINGIPNPRFSLSPALWSGGERGLWYIGSSGQPWPNGVYEFTLFIEGTPAGVARITIGGGPLQLPTFSDIVFGLPDRQDNVFGSGYVLPSGNIVSALFIYRDIANGTPWTEIWSYEDEQVRFNTDVWNQGPGGATTISVVAEGGLLPGRYRLELYIEERLATTADFIIAGAQEGAFAAIFENVRFASQIAEGAPAGSSGATFPNTVSGLYAFVDWRLLAPGTPWTYRWRVDGEVFFEHTEGWVAPESGVNFWLRLGSDLYLPDGSYTLELLAGGLLLTSTTVEVGLGQLPVARGSQASGVQLSGQVADAQTGEGIPGVLFIVLEAEFSVEDFLWDESQVFGLSLTDSQGYFEIARLLPPDNFYSVLVLAEGYLPVAADGIYLDPAGPRQLALRLEMNRD